VSTGATSTAPVVLATLVPALVAAPALTGVQTLYGDTAQAERENLLVTGNITWNDEIWAALGARSREEQYVIDGYVQVRRPGDSQQAAHERAFVLLAAVESVLRGLIQPGMGFSAALSTAFGVGKAQVVNVEFKPTKAMGFPGPEGMAAQVDFGVRVTARI